MTARSVDVYLTGGGTLYLFMLLTPAAHEWVDEHVSDNRMMLGRSLVVEWRYAADLAAGMRDDGLVIDDDEVRG